MCGGMLEAEYLSASEAATRLGVSVQTLYVYVGRKGIRSQPIAGSRQRRYWKADIERVARRESVTTAQTSQLRQESEITLTTDSGLFYRGHNAADLAEHCTFESLAALLWGVREEEAFTGIAPRPPDGFSGLHELMAHESDIDRASTILPLFEQCNPKAYDLSLTGMARSGADVLRTLAAITVGSDRPAAEPIHQFIARHIGATPLQTELIRRQLVLAADHGFEPVGLPRRWLLPRASRGWSRTSRWPSCSSTVRRESDRAVRCFMSAAAPAGSPMRLSSFSVGNPSAFEGPTRAPYRLDHVPTLTNGRLTRTSNPPAAAFLRRMSPPWLCMML